MEDKELQKFYTNIQEEVKASLISEEEGTNPEQIFTELALSFLSDAGETENYRVCYDEKLSNRGVEHKINGYSLYENYETLDLFVTWYHSESNIQSTKKMDIDWAISKIENFFRNAIYKDYITSIEESSEIFDLAQTLANVPEVKEFLTRVNIFLITNGEVKSDLKTSDTVAGYPVFYRIIDINYLYNLSDKSRIPIEIDFEEFGYTIPCIANKTENKDYQSWLAIIPGPALADIYEQYGARLLEQNVRSFLQFTGKINKGIRNTILKEQHMFMAFNNGIAATAEEVIVTNLSDNQGKAIAQVKDFQIVNGGQTTASIYHTWKKDKVDLSNVFVPVKLTIVKVRENFSEIVGRIAEYANTQNRVSASDLSSNRENHVIIEKLSRTIWAPPVNGQSFQTRWFFERSRGQYRNERSRHGITPSKKKQFDKQNPRSQMFTKELLAKYINTYEEVYNAKKLVIGPHIVVRGSQKNYAQFLNYNFSKKPDNIWFEDAIAKAILFSTAEKIYGVKPNAIGDMRYITVPYSIAWLSYKLNYQLDLYKIWKEQDLDEKLRSTLEEIMIKVEQFIKLNAPGSLYGEWAKKEECWIMLKEDSLGMGLSNLNSLLVKPQHSNKRKQLSERDVNDIIIASEEELIRSIPIEKWSMISKIGSDIEELTQHQKDRSINILSTLKLKKSLSDNQRQDAIKILDIILKNSPQFFDEISIQKPITRNEISLNKINPELLLKMVMWDTKAKVLTPRELEYVTNFAYGFSKLNDFHKQNIIRHLSKLQAAGFIP
ncbi:MAG TPA: abortive phage resistance protein [Aequorivita sp.]|nr:abortive phage resistance protein [Aequorivita sp.]|tara:strand:+ start:7944 stop:10268 length:2325 start_codon:yes stop_codon:yes gene_type:complete